MGPQSNQLLKFELSVEFAQIIMQGLGEIPFKTAAPVVEAIRNQASAQLNAPAPAVSEAE